jgi:hypothetical protein
MRTRLAAVVLPAALALGLAGGGTPDAAAVPRSTAAWQLTASSMTARYDTTASEMRQARSVALRRGDTRRARALEALDRPGRRFLTFDARGDGRVVEVIGDLAGARRIAVIVPGADTGIETFDRRGSDPYAAPGGAARTLAAFDPDGHLAVVAWLGYDTPSTRSLAVATAGRAVAGGRELGAFLASLRAVNPNAETALLCHSYGSVVCAEAVRAGGDVSDLVFFGSPGVGVQRATDLPGAARVWAGRGDGDWIRHVAGARLSLFGVKLGFGTDPVTPEFGARVFAAGSGGHSDYLRPGSPSLRNLALLALGRSEDVANPIRVRPVLQM